MILLLMLLFSGTKEERFIRAMNHYKEAMGIDQKYVFDFRLLKDYCSSVSARSDGAVMVRYDSTLSDCETPETLALHESCHVRYAHHLRWSSMTDEAAHHEIKYCMQVWLVSGAR